VSFGASKVILAVRSLKKGEDSQREIEQRTGRHDCIEVWQLDLGSYDSIRAFAQRAEKLPKLDIAILNAGVYNFEYKTSQYGWEEDLQVNALSTAYLALLLLPKLRTSATDTGERPVLELVGSGLHATLRLTAEEKNAESFLQIVNDPGRHTKERSYAASKLVVMYVMETLAEMAKDSSGEPVVIVNAVCVCIVHCSDVMLSLTFPLARSNENAACKGCEHLDVGSGQSSGICCDV
jgi:NAD(P)-dependent dehydrogenase (short-subunit alcohol dehydrogenase family)